MVHDGMIARKEPDSLQIGRLDHGGLETILLIGHDKAQALQSLGTNRYFALKGENGPTVGGNPSRFLLLEPIYSRVKTNY